jgi:malto-oligosyltrehalose trehalohydrolase
MIEFGAKSSKKGVSFRLWAPAAKHVDVLLEKSYPMVRDADGWFSVRVPEARPGARYKYLIDHEIEVPDPASEFQPEDVAGPSEVIDHTAYCWRCTNWRGRPWREAVVLEAHVGTFTQEGTYRAMTSKLDHLVQTGITALELMPLADFPGAQNWGYDGVLWYAPDSTYGRPEDLKALIDEAHLRGMMVLLDVVYNHFGPEGNYLGRYAPGFFMEAQTPWGNAIDYRVPQVRRFAVDNAIHWLRDYRFDGLRLDAVHAISDPGKVLMLHELSVAVGKLADDTGRDIHLVLENDDNAVGLLDPTKERPDGKYRAQWNDDYHHAWHVLLTDETQGYYSDYQVSPLKDIARALESGFVYQGEASEHRGGKARGEPSDGISPLGFINFLQNHDQIGNRALGDRLEGQVNPKAMEAALAITLLAPMVPMLFMGEEWGSKSPFPFFCDFHGDLGDAVRAGRRREFEEAYSRYGDEIPDPLDSSTVQSAVLNWDRRDKEPGRTRQSLVRELLAIRRREIIPRLAGAQFGQAHGAENGLLTANWHLDEGSTLRLIANLSDREIVLCSRKIEGTPIWGGELEDGVPPWIVLWRIG